MPTNLESIFEMVGETVDATVPSGESEDSKGATMAKLLDDTPPEGPSAEVVMVEIDAVKAAKLNKYVQTGLSKLAEMSVSAADQMCNSIAAGDQDARTIEGTARLVESATKAYCELNRYNMFLQEQMVDMRLRNELEKMRLQAEKMRTETTREALLSALEEQEDKKTDVSTRVPSGS